MSTATPLDSLHTALSHAIHVALPDIVYKRKDWTESKKQNADVFVEELRRPNMYDVTVDMFTQTWSDTSLGFGGMAGQAFTESYTVVVYCAELYSWAVYHGGRFAYLINYHKQSDKGRQAFIENLASRNLAGFLNKAKYK